MPRPHRYTDDYQPGGHIFELSRKTVAGTYLLRPDPALNALIVGEYAAALRLPRFAGHLRIHELVLQSNHLHVLLSASTQEAIEDFEEHLASVLAIRVGALRGWEGRVWNARYNLSQVFPSKQRARQHYLHSQGLPENLYERPDDNPCVSSYKAWSRGKRRLQARPPGPEALKAAGISDGDPERAWFERALSIELYPMPIDEGRTKAELVALVRDQGRSITAEHAKRRSEQGVKGVLGARAMLEKDPFDRPKATKRGRAAPLAIGTEAEVAAFEARHALAGEQRRALMARLVRDPGLADYPEQAAMPSILRAAIQRANEEDLKAAQVLIENGQAAAAAALLAASPRRRAWPALPPAPEMARGAKPKKRRAAHPKRRKAQPSPVRRRRLRGRTARRRPVRVTRRPLSPRPLQRRVIALPPVVAGGPRRFVVVWLRRCAADADEGDGAALA